MTQIFSVSSRLRMSNPLPGAMTPEISAVDTDLLSLELGVLQADAIGRVTKSAKIEEILKVGHIVELLL